MASVESVRAIANNEVAFVAWTLDSKTIDGLLGFHVVREYLNEAGEVTSERPLASYVGFRGQRNPLWLAQNTTVWPVQKFVWRDLTLRKRRDDATRRPESERVRYRVQAVGLFKDGMEPVEVVEESHHDAKAKTRVVHTYEGDPVPLGYLTAPAHSNIIEVTSKRGKFHSTFTNGILSTQFLTRVVEEQAGKSLTKRLQKPGEPLREYLSGDVLETIRDFLNRPGGRFHAALYELEDEELLHLLVQNADRLSLILSDAGSDEKAKPPVYDTRNKSARAALRKAAKTAQGFEMQDRLFNGSGHIGHNKFIVHIDDEGKAQSVLTGSTNWTWSGIAGQSNNTIRIDDPKVADAFLKYWHRLFDDPQPKPKPLSARNSKANQSDDLKWAGRKAHAASIGGGIEVECWFSPNMPGKKAPPSASKPQGVPPPDMERLFSLMRKARSGIFFLVFLPSRGGVNSIISEAVNLGSNDTSLSVIGAISDTQAMWAYEAAGKTPEGKKIPAWSPHTFQQGGVSVVRATALTDREIGREIGDFVQDETLTLGKAIIHDKILVVDPLDPDNCVVAFGSHNLGYRASYANDENLVIVRGHQALAEAYAAHVLDVYDHYRFRAREAEQTAAAKGKKVGAGTKVSATRWDGFLDPTDGWQKMASRRLARYLTSGD